MPARWYYQKDGKEIGPVSAGELKGLVATCQLTSEDLVRKDGIEKWVPASKVAGLIRHVELRPASQINGSSKSISNLPNAKTSPQSKPSIGEHETVAREVATKNFRQATNQKVSPTTSKQSKVELRTKTNVEKRVLSSPVALARTIFSWTRLFLVYGLPASSAVLGFLALQAIAVRDKETKTMPTIVTQEVTSDEIRTTINNENVTPENIPVTTTTTTRPKTVENDEISAATPVAIETAFNNEPVITERQQKNTDVEKPEPEGTGHAEDDVKVEPVEANSDTQGVIAEGIGANSNEAIKDAFRNAVRQVVGAVVDAETLVKDDEIINDKVLTYSDGFIKTYDEVPGSKKVQNGLHHIRIKAKVERRSVIAKLSTANVTMKEIDGKGLFAEAVTQLNAENDADALLRKQFEDFPQSLMTAEVIGRPEILKKTSDTAIIRIKMQIEPNVEAYRAFVARLEPMLEKVAKDKGEFTAAFKTEEGPESFRYFSPNLSGGINIMASWMPKAITASSGPYIPIPINPKLNTDYTTIAIASQPLKADHRLECRYYLLDKSLQAMFVDIGFRKGSGTLSLFNKLGKVVAEESFPLSESVPRTPDVFEGTLITMYGGQGNFYTLSREEKWKRDAYLFWVTPAFIKPNTNRINLKKELQVSQTLSLGLNELKSVKDIKVKITFDE